LFPLAKERVCNCRSESTKLGY